MNFRLFSGPSIPVTTDGLVFGLCGQELLFLKLDRYIPPIVRGGPFLLDFGLTEQDWLSDAVLLVISGLGSTHA